MTPEQFKELMAHVYLISFSVLIISLHYYCELLKDRSWLGTIGYTMLIALAYNLVIIFYGG